MKQLARTVIALGLLLLSVAAAIYFLSPDTDAPASAPASESTEEVLRPVEELSFVAGDCQLSCGEQLTALIIASPEEHTEQIAWSSSDEGIASVDGNGTITARAPGTAVIYARTADCTAGLEITVTETSDWERRVLDALRLLSTDCGSGTAYIDAQLLCEQLSGIASDEAALLHELLDAVLDYSSGAGDRERLYAAIERTGTDRLTALTAAACCYAKHEMLTCDEVLSFAGDVTLARYNESASSERFPAVYAASDSYTYPFDRVRGIFSCDYMSVVNFEGTLTGRTSHRDKSFYFRGDPLYAGILSVAGIEAAGLENNHAGDYYSSGFEDTVRYITKTGVGVFYGGAPLTAETGTLSGQLRVVLLGFMYIGSNIPQDTLDGWLASIRQHSTPDTVVIVSIHWGVEGETEPTSGQQEAAHAMVDAGADLIVGHHPHVLQGIECYNGRYIAYSLGNFAFGGNATANNPETVILRAIIGREDGGPAVTGISIVPCLATSSGSTRNNYQPCILFGGEGQRVADLLLRRSAYLEYGIKELHWSGI